MSAMPTFDPREWATRTVQWQPARNGVKYAVHAAARARGRVLERRGDIGDPSTIIAAGPPKAGTQWVKALFDHPVVRAHTRMLTLPQLDYSLTPPRRGFPARTFVPGFSTTYPEYAALPKPHPTRAIYLARDPRDAFVSGYWSAVETHRVTHLKEVEDLRAELKQMPMSEALLTLIRSSGDYLASLASWLDVDDPSVARFRLEDLRVDGEGHVRAMLEHCDVGLSSAEFATVVRETSREALRAKDLEQRAAGQESHYRERPSRYQDVFTAEHHAAIEEMAPGLIERMGYPPA